MKQEARTPAMKLASAENNKICLGTSINAANTAQLLVAATSEVTIRDVCTALLSSALHLTG